MYCRYEHHVIIPKGVVIAKGNLFHPTRKRIDSAVICSYCSKHSSKKKKIEDIIFMFVYLKKKSMINYNTSPYPLSYIL